MEDRYIYFNPNPKGLNVGDCVVRALCLAFREDWIIIFSALIEQARNMCDMPSANHVWGAFLRRNGYTRNVINVDADVYTVRDFCIDNPRGTYILATDGHVVTVRNGRYYDSWDSGNEIPIYFWSRNE